MVPFIFQDLFEEIDIDLRLGYHVEGETKGTQKKVCKQNKSIFGLKQATRQWFSKFAAVLLKLGSTQSKSDYSLFTKNSGASFIALLVYVDDIIIVSANQKLIASLKSEMQAHLQLKDFGTLHFFLGLEIARTQAGIFLSWKSMPYLF